MHRIVATSVNRPELKVEGNGSWRKELLFPWNKSALPGRRDVVLRRFLEAWKSTETLWSKLFGSGSPRKKRMKKDVTPNLHYTIITQP